MPGQLLAVVTKELPQQPLDPVAANGPTDLAADGQTESGGAACFQHGDDDEVGRVLLATLPPDPVELVAASQPAFWREGITTAH